MKTNQTWTITKNKNVDRPLGLVVILIGIILFLFYYLSRNSSSDAIYLLWISFLFIFLGAGVYFLEEEIITTIDPELKRLEIKVKNRLFSRSHKIHFVDIKCVEIYTVNKHRAHTLKIYVLRIRLLNDQSYRLGKEDLDQNILIPIGEKLSNEINCKLEFDHPGNAMNVKFIPFALLGSVLIYSIWYRLTVGPLCSAMWGGTAPIVIIAITFYYLMLLSKLKIWK